MATTGHIKQYMQINGVFIPTLCPLSANKALPYIAMTLYFYFTIIRNFQNFFIQKLQYTLQVFSSVIIQTPVLLFSLTALLTPFLFTSLTCWGLTYQKKMFPDRIIILPWSCHRHPLWQKWISWSLHRCKARWNRTGICDCTTTALVIWRTWWRMLHTYHLHWWAQTNTQKCWPVTGTAGEIRPSNITYTYINQYGTNACEHTHYFCKVKCK
jgi:hypothetical protein